MVFGGVGAAPLLGVFFFVAAVFFAEALLVAVFFAPVFFALVAFFVGVGALIDGALPEFVVV